MTYLLSGILYLQKLNLGKNAVEAPPFGLAYNHDVACLTTNKLFDRKALSREVGHLFVYEISGHAGTGRPKG